MSNYLFDSNLGGVDLEPAYGGVSRVALINKSQIESYTLSTDSTEVTAVTLKTSAKFHEVITFGETATYKSEWKLAGTDRYFDQTLDFTVMGQDAATISATRKLLLTNKLVALVERASGQWVLLNIVGTGLTITAGSQNAVAEQNGRVFSLNGKSSYEPLLVDDSVAVALIA